MLHETRVVGDVHVLTPRKNLTGGVETKALMDAVAGLSTPKVVLDMQRINWVSSLAVEELRRIHHTCHTEKGWLKLVYVGTRIKNVLLTSRLHWVFETFDSIEEAIAPAGSASVTAENKNSRRRVVSTPGI
jgi:anti-anti-sigma factor